MPISKLIRIASFLILLSSQANAYVGAVNSATGSAGIAAVESSEAPFGNPAAVAFLKGYYFSAGYGSAMHKGPAGAAQDMAFSLTDNMRDTVVPTSLAYSQTTIKPTDYDETLQRNLRLSIGNFWSDRIAGGLAITNQDDRLTMLNYSQTNLEAGMLFSLNERIGFALVLENLLMPDSDIPEAYRQTQTTALGASYNFRKTTRFKMDLISSSGNSIGKPTLGFGVENYLNKWLIVRMGAQRNSELSANLYTAGTGFMGPKFAVNYAYQNSSQDQSLTRHSVDLAVPIW